MKRPAPQPTRRAVIVSTRPWNAGMARRLARRTGWQMTTLASPRELTRERLGAIRPRYVFFPHWSHRIPADIHHRFECVIFHMTDLPYGRGGSPLQNLIARGIYETKVSALRCVEEMDAGPVYLKRALSLHGSAEEIFMRASGVVEDMIADMLARPPRPRPQRGPATVFRRRQPEDGVLSDARSISGAFDLIRMLDAEGYPPAFVRVGPFKIEFTRASLRTDGVLADARITLANSEAKNDQNR
jgi:methionyl-tRNA formyltransferase